MVVINIVGVDPQRGPDPFKYHVRSYRGDFSYSSRDGILSIPIDAANTLRFAHPMLQSFENGKMTFLAFEENEDISKIEARLITIENA